jgi:TolB-like protein
LQSSTGNGGSCLVVEAGRFAAGSSVPWTTIGTAAMITRVLPRHVVVTLAAFALARPLLAQCPDGTPPPCTRAVRMAAPPPNSVAVLYFDNQSRDSTDAYLADGLTEQVIQRLGEVSRLVVKSKYSVRRYRGTDLDPRDVGRTLQVTYIGGGSVRRAGSRLRVNVELTRAATGDRVWGETYDRADNDVLAIEEEIAGAVATAIAGRLLPAERARIGTRQTSNTAAYDHLSRGNYLIARRSPDPMRRGIAEYEAAVRADPGLTAASAQAAFAYGIYASWEWPWPGLTRDSILARGAREAATALRADSTDPVARVSLCVLGLDEDRDVAGALRCLRRIPGARAARSIDVQAILGWVLVTAGQNDAVAEQFQRALALDPARTIVLEIWARMLTHERRYGEARRLLDSAVAVDPEFPAAYPARARLRLLEGDTAGALADAQTAARLTPSVPVPFLVVVLARSDTARAAAALRDMLATTDSAFRRTAKYGPGFAAALLALGRRDDATALLERITFRDYELYGELQNPEFDPLRDDPRFRRIFEQARPAGAPVWTVPR